MQLPLILLGSNITTTTTTTNTRIDHWPLTIDHWQFTIDNSQLTIDHWPLTIDHWHLTIDHWQLTIDNCPSTIYNCTLAIAWSLLRNISFVPYDFQWLRSPKLFHFWIIEIHTPYALICMFSAVLGLWKSSREQLPRGSVHFHTITPLVLKVRQLHYYTHICIYL